MEHFLLRTSCACLALAAGMNPDLAHAQSAGPGAVFALEAITIDGRDRPDTAEALRARLRDAPLAASVVDAAEYALKPAPDMADALATAPGVIVQEFFGGNDQPRIQIRGSGLQQNPTERGLLVLQDGMPINRADGSYIVGLGAPGQAEAIEVWRGASANRLGATVLGGALNFISPSARSAPGTALGFGAGSFGQRSITGQTTIESDTASALLRFELSDSDGERDWNGSRRAIIGGNVEFSTGEAARTRMFFSHADLRFDVAGPLTWGDLVARHERVNQNPMQGPMTGNGSGIGPNVVRDRPGRETVQTLIGTRTTVDLGVHSYDFGASVSRTDDQFVFPVGSGIRATDGWDASLMARYAYAPDAMASLPLFEATALYALGKADRAYYHNAGGARGPQFGAGDLRAETLSLHAGANIPLGRLTVSPGLSYARATRENVDLRGNGTSYDRSYDQWSPSVALTWKPVEDQTVWLSAARSFDAPTSDDLLATVGGTPNTGPTGIAAPDLGAQRADTVELGWRGSYRGIDWDLTAYHARLRNELLQLSTSTGASYTTNADRTKHTGFEAAISAEITPRLNGRIAYTWQDFRFDGDPSRGGNRLAGAPENVLTARLDWAATDALTLSGTLRWMDKIPVDNMNTTWSEATTLLDLGAAWQVTDNAAIVAEITNVTDERFAASTLTMDALPAPNFAAYIPGQGRAFHIGAKLRF